MPRDQDDISYDFGKKLKVIAAIVIGPTVLTLLALFVSIYEARNNSLYIKASMTPKVFFDATLAEDGFTLSISNAGLGPAQVGWFKVFVDGKQAKTWHEVLRFLDVPETEPFDFSMLYPGSVIQVTQPGGGKKLLHLTNYTIANNLFSASRRIEPFVCVCSLFDACEIIAFGFNPQKVISQYSKMLPECNANYEDSSLFFWVDQSFSTSN